MREFGTLEEYEHRYGDMGWQYATLDTIDEEGCCDLDGADYEDEDYWARACVLGRDYCEEGEPVAHTGAAVGADQAFAEGAIEVDGLVSLCLPWRSYEDTWVRWAVARGKALVRVLQPSDAAAWASVAHHPAAARLSCGARALHARNHLIISGCSWVAAFPQVNPYGQLGGTGQGMALAERLGIPVLDLRTI